MKTFITITQIILSITLIILVLLQSHGTGLGKTYGGSTTSFTRRGLENLIYKLTFVVVALFIIISIFEIVQ